MKGVIKYLVIVVAVLLIVSIVVIGTNSTGKAVFSFSSKYDQVNKSRKDNRSHGLDSTFSSNFFEKIFKKNVKDSYSDSKSIFVEVPNTGLQSINEGDGEAGTYTINGVTKTNYLQTYCESYAY